MEPKFQTSFIPKKPIVATSGTSVSVIHETNVFAVIATVVFIVTIATSGGLFAYKSSLTNQIAAADKKILEARAALQPETIRDLVDSNSRIVSSKSLLEKHVVVSKLLKLLETLTLKKMRFTTFTYTYANGVPKVSMTGEVQTYNALAQQQDIFSKNEFIKNPQFSNFNLSDNGYIAVAFSATIDPMLVSYKKAIDSMTLTPQ